MIRRREGDFARRALASWATNPNLRILGNRERERLAIVSFGVRHPRGLLHSNFVVAVLSDLFGIQARSGCFCAGPYIHRAYPIDDAWSAEMDAQARLGRIGATLAFARVSFDYFISEAVFDYIVDAVHLIANDGLEAAAALPLRSRHGPLAPRGGPRGGAAAARRRPRRGSTTAPESALAGQLDDGAQDHPRRDATPVDPVLSPEFERIRWFPLPGECAE